MGGWVGGWFDSENNATLSDDWMGLSDRSSVAKTTKRKSRRDLHRQADLNSASVFTISPEEEVCRQPSSLLLCEEHSLPEWSLSYQCSLGKSEISLLLLDTLKLLLKLLKPTLQMLPTT